MPFNNHSSSFRGSIPGTLLNIKNGHHNKAVVFAMNCLENDYTPVTSFGKCKLKLNCNNLIALFNLGLYIICINLTNKHAK
jgi:hypothetical protein